MIETEDKSPSKGGKEIGEINISSESVPELRTQIRLSKGLQEHFGDRELTIDERTTLSMTQEFALYYVGLNRLHEWADGISDSIGDFMTALNLGDYSKCDELLDRITEGSPWSCQQIRDLLIQMALIEVKII